MSPQSPEHSSCLPLAELQRMMMAAICGAAPAAALVSVLRTGRGLAPEAALAIYRNGTRATLVATLQLAYPVSERLVGASFFGAAAEAFVAGHPSRSGDLEDYGEHFGDFLAAYPPAQSLPYLGDIAHLEWIVGSLRRAAAVPLLDRQWLAAHPSDAIADLRIELAPRAALFASTHPAARIWRAHQQTDGIPDFEDIDDSGDRVLIVADDALQLLALDAASHRFHETLVAGKTVADAVEQALACNPQFDFGAAFARALDAGAFAAGAATAG